MADKPLLTLAICCYKFERFIDEALDGAFAQTYRPLEIVISDDHSPDSTWQHILDYVAARFPNAPLDRTANLQTLTLPPVPPSHSSSSSLTVILNRNPTNLGLAFHENRLFELSHGEWIAFQSGDDVSTPNRMEKIAEAVQQNPKIRCIECRSRAVNPDGAPYPIPAAFLKAQEQGKTSFVRELPSILGAGAVYHRDVYWKFGPLGKHVSNEDHVLPFRAALLGKIVRIREVLVLYKKHGGNQSGAYDDSVQSAIRFRNRMLYMYYQELSDLHHAELQQYVTGKSADVYRRLILDKIYQFRFAIRWSQHSESRMRLLARLALNPRQCCLFCLKMLEVSIRRFS